jgi:hypothetical protein
VVVLQLNVQPSNNNPFYIRLWWLKLGRGFFFFKESCFILFFN